VGDTMTAAERKSLREDIEALRAELRAEIGAIKARLDALERPRDTKVVFDPSRSQEPGGGHGQ
jgi:hypothetical protein